MNNIQVIRKRLGITQSELAQLAGCTPGAIGHYEAGRRSMDIQTCRSFVAIFNKLGEPVGLDDVSPQQTTVKQAHQFDGESITQFSRLSNHSLRSTTVSQQKTPDWQAEKQPEWVVNSARKIITGLPGGYAEAAQWLGVTEDALFNRLRPNSNQIFPIGWFMVLQRAGGNTHFADAVSRQSRSVNVRLPEVEDVDRDDINAKLMEAIEYIGKHSELVRKFTEDGEIDAAERKALDANTYRLMATFQEHILLLYSVFCPEEVAPIHTAKWRAPMP